MRHCTECGRPLTSQQKVFCSAKCRQANYRRELSNPYIKLPEKKTTAVPFHEIIAGAMEEDISYGEYVAKHGV